MEWWPPRSLEMFVGVSTRGLSGVSLQSPPLSQATRPCQTLALPANNAPCRVRFVRKISRGESVSLRSGLNKGWELSMNTQPPLGWGRGAVSPVTETTGQAVGTVTMGVGTRYNGSGNPLQWGIRYNGCGEQLQCVWGPVTMGDSLQWVWGLVTMGVGTLQWL